MLAFEIQKKPIFEFLNESHACIPKLETQERSQGIGWFGGSF